MKSRIFISVISAVLLGFNQFFTYAALADEYIVSGNGEGSSNNIDIQKDSSKEVTQENQAKVNNDTTASSETGENKANENNSETTNIETGEASQEVKIENSANTNSAQVDCCPTQNESTAQISDNGSESDNQINSTQDTNTVVAQSNTAKINNNVSIYANTGDNEASDNDGEVRIITGNVGILAAILNQNINSSEARVANPNLFLNLKIFGNGPGSTNNVDDDYIDNEEFLVNNYLDLKNNITNDVNTGGNKANNNKGKVFISTGSVLLDIILNTKANTSTVLADCNCKSPTPSPTPSPSQSPSPSTPPSGGSGGGNSGGGGSGGSGGGNSSGGGGSSGGGEVLGASTLPATGGFSIWQATGFALALLVLGIMLRIDYAKAKSNFQYINHSFSMPVAIYLFTYSKSVSFPGKTKFASQYAFYLHPQNPGLRSFG
jgi:uncharacterized membrane protein YgcG